MRNWLFLVSAVVLAAPCTAPTGIAVAHRNGQTFVTWTDVASGAGGSDYRYKVYRDTSGQITSITGLQPFAQVLNNNGQLNKQLYPTTQAYRQDSTKRMAIVESGGAQLAFGTGLAVYTPTTATSAAYYAVTTTSVTSACTESTPNYTTSPVSESVSTAIPVKQIPYTDASQNPSTTGITGTQRPLWVQLHASGGGYPSRGDLWAYWGDATMGWYGGIQQVFAVWEDKNQGTFQPISLVWSPQDFVHTINATTTASIETWWMGYYGAPINSSTLSIHPYTERWLDSVFSWVRTSGQYNVNTNKIYSWGKSMGAWGSASWAIRRPSIFAAHFLHLPRWRSTNTAGTWQVPSLPAQANVTATSLSMENGVAYTSRNDQVAYVTDCSVQLRPVLWGIGSADEFSRWQDHLDMVSALNTCKRAYAFKWSASNHSTDNSLAQLLTEYQQVYAKNVSHPAFTSSTLNNNPSVDATGCINCGWTWTILSDTSTSWSASLANSNNSAGVTVSVTPRNTQQFGVIVGETVSWSCPSCTVTSGTAVADAYGTVTASITLPASTTVTLTFTRSTAPETMTNKVTLRDLSGAGQGARTWVIPRYFAQDEICTAPKPYVSGVAAAYWQSHVETRWPASSICATGSVKLAVIAVEATVGALSSVEVDFQNSTDYCHLGGLSTCEAAGATKSDLLNFNTGDGVGSWGARISARTGGIEMSRSARTMINSNYYQILRNGPLYVEVLVREGPEAVAGTATRTTNFGWQCTATCTSPYASATWADNSTYYSIRPTFHLRFYRRWGRIEGDFVAHSGWNDRYVDQRVESFNLYTGSAETTSAISNSYAFVLTPKQTWVEGPFWQGGTPGRSTINFNPAYLMMSKLIPTQEIDKYPITSTSSAYHYANWTASDQGATTTLSLSPAMGVGNINRTIATAGSNSYTGLFPSWTTQYLTSMDPDDQDIVIGNARAGMHFPWAWLEGATTGTWATGTSVNPFGRPISVEQRTDFIGGLFSNTNAASYVTAANRVKSPAGNDILTSCADASCYVGCYDSAFTWCTAVSTSYPNPGTPDRAHHPELFFNAYLITGKPMYREALQHQAAWEILAGQPIVSSSQPTPRWYQAGLIYDASNMIRAVAWPLRTIGHAALLSVDGSAEKTYFERILNNNIEAHEGRLAITDGAYPPSSTTAPYGCPFTSASSYYNTTPTNPGTISKWCFGRYYFDLGLSNGMQFPGRFNAPNVSPPSRGYGVDLRYASSMYPVWMSGYWAVVLGHLRDLGFTQTAKLQEAASKFFLRLYYDSGCNKDFSCTTYYSPLYNAAGSSILTNPADVLAGIVRGAPLSRSITSSSSTVRIASVISNNSLGPVWNPTFTVAGGPMKIGSEWVLTSTSSATITVLGSGSITASNDRITFPSAHGYQDGDLIEFTPVATGDSTEFNIATTDSNCIMPSGKGHCRWYVKVISTTVIEVYRDSALTDKVDFIADQSSIWAGYVSIPIESDATKCGNTSCRGYLNSTAASHSPGENVVAGAMAPSWYFYFIDPGWAYGHIARTALAYAATYPPTLNDSVTGSRMSPTQAYAHLAANVALQDQYGDNGSCTTIQNCGANRWAWTPYQGPKNIRVDTSTAGAITLRWAAPNGKTCKVAVSQTMFASTDDSLDDDDGGTHLSRSYTVSGLSAGTAYYRITCGYGRYVGSATIQ